MKNTDVIDINEEKKPEYAEDAFKGMIPEFSFSVNGTQAIVRVKAIV